MAQNLTIEFVYNFHFCVLVDPVVWAFQSIEFFFCIFIGSIQGMKKITSMKEEKDEQK